MEKNIEGVCQNCAFWAVDSNTPEKWYDKKVNPCLNPFFWTYCPSESSWVSCAVTSMGTYENQKIIHTGADFGCIHFKARP